MLVAQVVRVAQDAHLRLVQHAVEQTAAVLLETETPVGTLSWEYTIALVAQDSTDARDAQVFLKIHAILAMQVSHV